MAEFLIQYSWIIKGLIWMSAGWMLGVITIGIFSATDEPRGQHGQDQNV